MTLLRDSAALFELRTARRHAEEGWRALARRWYWIFLRRHATEICACGRPVGPHTDSWWHTDDDLWIEVTEPKSIERGRYREIGTGVLCPPCFTKACRAKGIHIFWHARVEYRDGQDVEEGQRLAGLRA